jgi:equilibrative nucleoside transporter 1/2/3
MFLFALSNGYLSTLIMLAAVSEPSLEDEEVEVAATCLAFYLTLGLAGGSFVSFGVLAFAKAYF